jgi:hypothetical protein
MARPWREKRGLQNLKGNRDVRAADETPRLAKPDRRTAALRTSLEAASEAKKNNCRGWPNDIEFSGEKEGAQRLTPSPLQ